MLFWFWVFSRKKFMFESNKFSNVSLLFYVPKCPYFDCSLEDGFCI